MGFLILQTGRNFAAGMSGGIAYIFDPNNEFQKKCNTASVDLLPLEKAEDIKFVKDTLQEFEKETGSEVARRILSNLEIMKKSFIKVFPHEYQRALMELEMEKKQVTKTIQNGQEVSGVAVSNGSIELNGKLNVGNTSQWAEGSEKVALNNMSNGYSNGIKTDSDHQKSGKEINGHTTGGKETKCKAVADIEDAVSNLEMKKRKVEVLQTYDKVRGFVKYQRENKPYRDPKLRQNDWDEIFDFKHVRRGKTICTNNPLN